VYIDISQEIKPDEKPLSSVELEHFEMFDLIYRSLCALLFNYAPTSGHPGGSISSGRIVFGLVFDAMDYDVSNPDRQDADIISYAAGHKALGLYTMWALRNEVMRIGAPELLPPDKCYQLRLEDLLGFRRNPITKTPFFTKFDAKPLDGHPTPATPFLRLATGASGVGLATSMGLAFGAMDYYGNQAPRVHMVEGEGGMTPGRVSETMAAAGTASLKNAILHIDFNQASIDSNHVCRDVQGPGDYVQWDPMEFAYLHDWNVILVPEGNNYQQIFSAQRKAADIDNNQPTAIVYQTTKGWKYGIEGKASHGAGHKLCTAGFYEALKPFVDITGAEIPQCGTDDSRCQSGQEKEVLEECFWQALMTIRTALEKNVSTAATADHVLMHRLSVQSLIRPLKRPKQFPANLLWFPGRRQLCGGNWAECFSITIRSARVPYCLRPPTCSDRQASIPSPQDSLKDITMPTQTPERGFFRSAASVRTLFQASLPVFQALVIISVWARPTAHSWLLLVISPPACMRSAVKHARRSKMSLTELLYSFVHIRASKQVRTDRHTPIPRPFSFCRAIFPPIR
jgi:transketolase